MSRSIIQSIEDSLYYFRRGNVDQGMEILEARVTNAFLKDLANLPPPSVPGSDTSHDLKGVRIALWIGHEPGGGTSGERTWNIKLAKQLKADGERRGAEVRIYFHRIASYGRRQAAMRFKTQEEARKGFVPNIMLELHYDAVKSTRPNGFHFQFRGARILATAMSLSFHAHFPNRKKRYDGGLRKNMNGRGAGFMKQAPYWAVLCEPFMNSNPAERAFFIDKIPEVSVAYLDGISNGLSKMAA